MKTAIIYCRTSTTRQKAEETIGAQQERCRRLVERHGLTLLNYGPKQDGWILDDGASGTLLDGRLMGQLLEDLDAKRIRPDVLVVYSLSRISRVDRVSKSVDKVRESHVAAAKITAALISSQTKIVDEDGVMDPGSPLFSIKAMFAAEEYAAIRNRTMAGKSRRLQEGKYAKGGKPPYGYKAIPVNGVDRKQGWTLAPHPEHAESLKKILGWYLEGGVTHAARLATEAGIPTPMASTTSRRNKAADWTPTRWSPVSVQHIIRNARAYLGSTTLEFDGEPHTLVFPPLITAEEHAAIERRTRERTLPRRAQYLGTGFADCSCGNHLHQKNSHGDHYTRCNAACGSMRAEAFESILWVAITARLVQIQQHEQAVMGSGDPFGLRIKAAKGRVGDVEGEISRLLDVYLAGGLDKAIWKTKNDPLNAKLAQARAELEQVKRERDEYERKRAKQQTVEARVGTIIQELVKGEPPLERKRQILADLLGGQRVIVGWAPRTKIRVSPYALLTLPAFGTLPAITVRTDQVWDGLVGGLVQGIHVSTSDVGKGAEASLRALLAAVEAAGGAMTTKTKHQDGSITLKITTPNTYQPK